MITYSLNVGIRKKVAVILTLLSVFITFLLENTIGQYFKFNSDLFNNAYSNEAFKLLTTVAIPPFIVWCLLYTLYSKFLWKLPCLQVFHKIPNLNGVWNGYTFNSKKPNPKKRSVKVTIRQDWDHISIRTDMQDTPKESFCKCTVAAIDIVNGEVRLKYTYKNMLLGTESYVGYNELQMEENRTRIVGQYITTKPSMGTFNISKV